MTNTTTTERLDAPRTGRDGMIQSGTTYSLAAEYQRLRLRALGEEQASRVATFRQLVREISSLNPGASSSDVKVSAIRLSEVA